VVLYVLLIRCDGRSGGIRAHSASVSSCRRTISHLDWLSASRALLPLRPLSHRA